MLTDAVGLDPRVFVDAVEASTAPCLIIGGTLRSGNGGKRRSDGPQDVVCRQLPSRGPFEPEPFGQPTPASRSEAGLAEQRVPRLDPLRPMLSTQGAVRIAEDPDRTVDQVLGGEAAPRPGLALQSACGAKVFDLAAALEVVATVVLVEHRRPHQPEVSPSHDGTVLVEHLVLRIDIDLAHLMEDPQRRLPC